MLRFVISVLAAHKGQSTTLVNGAAVEYYGFHHDDQEINEASDNGNDFLTTLTRNGEETARQAEQSDDVALTKILHRPKLPAVPARSG